MSARARAAAGRMALRFAAWVPAALLGGALAGGGCAREERAETVTAVVERGPLAVWSAFRGRIEARRVHTILAPVSGQATLIEIAPDGSLVRAGEVVARFDSSRIERDLVRLEAARVSAQSDFETLAHAEWPLKIEELDRALEEARDRAEEEELALADFRELLAEGLMTAEDIRQQELRHRQAVARLRQMETQRRLSLDYLRPLGLAQARARFEAAQREWELARQEIEACVVRAPADGRLVHVPLSLGGEFRAARVGDALFKNQPFLVIPEPGPLVAHGVVPEADLGRVEVGAPARVVPAAFPELSLAATVESVGAAAQMVAGKPAWQRFFPVVIALDGADDRLRPGLSATVFVRRYLNESAVRVPRAAIRWNGDEAWVRVRRPGGTLEPRRIAVGWADDRWFEVLRGLDEGEQVEIQ
jgi:HlyD family secretion protein